MAPARRDASAASIKLTRNNFSGPQLLQTIRGTTGVATRADETPTRNRERSVDIGEPPMSSSEDEAPAPPPPMTKRWAEKMEENDANILARQARQAESKRGSEIAKSKPARLKVAETFPAPSPPAEILQDDVKSKMDDTYSWSQPTKRRKGTTYGTKNIPSTAPCGFNAVPPIASSPKKVASASEFTVPPLSSYTPKRKARHSIEEEIDIPPAADSIAPSMKGVESTFSIPPDLPQEPTSSSTIATEHPSVFDLPVSLRRHS